MKILVSWLREFVTVPVSLDELVAALNMRGFEVAAVEPPPPGVGRSGEDEAVLDLEITTNRPDCLSVLGIAREVATIYDTPLHPPGLPGTDGSDARLVPRASPSPAGPAGNAGNDTLSVTLEETALCPRYAAALADVNVSESPAWMTARLQAVGIRPINNVVDASNYVLMELGHPTHAFDLDRLAGREIRIRRARDGERLRTLDGVDRRLTREMLVIADAERAQAIAGVMGGADSEVSQGTRVVALESAFFQPVSVRRTSKQLGLSTEASYRFERGADISQPVVALERVCALLERIGAGRARGPVIDRYPTPRVPGRITFRHSRIRRLLGQSIDPAFVARTLAHLGFTLVALRDAKGQDGDSWWEVTVPAYRVDVTREVDLIEEVARHYGYDRLPMTFPALTQPPSPAGPWIERNRLVRQILTASGFSEAVTVAFVEQPAAAAFHRADDLVALANPLSEKLAVLRPSLLPGLVDSLVHNCRRERRDVRLFEIGHCFSRAGGETSSVAMAYTGAATVDHWSGGGRPVDFFDVKGIVERLLDAFGIAPQFEPLQREDLVPGRAALMRAPLPVTVPSEPIALGSLGQLAPAIAGARGLPAQANEVYVAEIDLRALEQAASPRDTLRVAPLPRYPSVVRDVSILVDHTLPAASVRGTIREAAGETLVDVREFDRYRGEGVPEGRLSLSLRLTFRSPERTLTDDEVQQTMEGVVEALERTRNARLR